MSVLSIAAVLLWTTLGQSISSKERASVVGILKSWQPPSNIDVLYDAYTHDRNSLTLKKSLISHLEVLPSYSTKVQKVLTEGDAFTRGEWQTPNGRDKFTSWIKMQTLHLASMRGSKFDCSRYQSEATIWFYFLAEMAYTESDGQALMLIAQLRKMLLEEVQFAVQNKIWRNCSTENSVLWWKSQRFPWPLDRIIVSEISKNRLSAKEQFWAKKGVIALQKNPYQSFSQWILSKQIFMSEGLKTIAKSWSPEHVEQMQREIQMHQNILLLIMSYDYESKVGHWPQNQAQLKTQGLILSELIDPITRKPQLIQKIK
jgi:hypothetical protein